MRKCNVSWENACRLNWCSIVKSVVIFYTGMIDDKLSYLRKRLRGIISGVPAYVKTFCVWCVALFYQLLHQENGRGHEVGLLDFISSKFYLNSIAAIEYLRSIRLDGPEDPHLRNSSFGGHVTALTLQYLWPRPPGVWLGGPGCKPGHSGRS